MVLHMQLNPMPPKLLEELKQKELVLIPELNYLGQLATILRAQGNKNRGHNPVHSKPSRSETLSKRSQRESKPDRRSWYKYEQEES